MKSWLVGLFLSSLRKQVPVSQHSNYILTHQNIELLKEVGPLDDRSVMDCSHALSPLVCSTSMWVTCTLSTGWAECDGQALALQTQEVASLRASKLASMCCLEDSRKMWQSRLQGMCIKLQCRNAHNPTMASPYIEIKPNPNPMAHQYFTTLRLSYVSCSASTLFLPLKLEL